jgi:2-hydroxychromene-2-carboxylate isomerase
VSENYKQRLDANTSDAIARGVFGVPTVDTGTRLYFGNDRLDLLDRHLSRG